MAKNKWSKEEWNKPLNWVKEHKVATAILIILVLFFGCMAIPSEKTTYICPDGGEVSNKEECKIEEQPLQEPFNAINLVKAKIPLSMKSKVWYTEEWKQEKIDGKTWKVSVDEDWAIWKVSSDGFICSENGWAKTYSNLNYCKPGVISQELKEEVIVLENTLGISRSAVINVMSNIERELENPSLPKGKDSPLADGSKRLLITYYDEITILELIGESNDLEKISFIVGISSDNMLSVTTQLLRMVTLTKLLAPEISNPADWLTEQIEILNSGREKIEVTKGNVRIRITDYRAFLGTIIITFEAK